MKCLMAAFIIFATVFAVLCLAAPASYAQEEPCASHVSMAQEQQDVTAHHAALEDSQLPCQQMACTAACSVPVNLSLSLPDLQRPHARTQRTVFFVQGQLWQLTYPALRPPNA